MVFKLTVPLAGFGREPQSAAAISSKHACEANSEMPDVQLNLPISPLMIVTTRMELTTHASTLVKLRMKTSFDSTMPSMLATTVKHSFRLVVRESNVRKFPIIKKSGPSTDKKTKSNKTVTIIPS